MQRYSVTIVSPGRAVNECPTLIVPFQPTALARTFIDELWKRVARQNISLAPNTHIATLHIDSETGAIIDCEDALVDVIDPKEKLFAIFAKRDDQPVAPPAAVLNDISDGEMTLSVRIITPALAKDKNACSITQVSVKSTMHQLRARIAENIHIRPKLDEEPELLECNCKLAADLATGPGSLTEFVVVHGKSIVERLPLQAPPTELTLREALRTRFGADIEAKKRVNLIDARLDNTHPGAYAKLPVVQICSKIRHAPRHARPTNDDNNLPRYKLLDLHTSEQPIDPVCMDITIEDVGLDSLAHNGAVDTFAVERTTTGNSSATMGKSSVYRSRPHWEPKVIQSDRGVAMFLSSLRVFISLLEDMKEAERDQDAVFHVLDLLTDFRPAVRAIHILAKGNTIRPLERSVTLSSKSWMDSSPSRLSDPTDLDFSNVHACFSASSWTKGGA